ncbi:MAG: DUF3375 domain-containing protein [Micrococcales bacterium]|nr:DUF3375 domain-containing protein [Micrococcales bacterium]
MRSRAEGVYAGALRAFGSPMLDLLHKPHAPLVVALLSLVFTAERRSVPVSDAHTEVADALAQLRSAGYEKIPDASARDLCRSWAEAGWLVRQIVDDVEVYRLSAHAVDALEVAGRAGGARARVTHSRLRTLLDAVARLAADADPDVMARMAQLDTQIKALRTELAQLERTGQVDEVPDDQLVEEAENVVHLAAELPADFARVAEAIKAMQRDVVGALRASERPTGEVLREYLARSEQVLDATPEGRAFAGALRLVGDPRRLDELADQLDTVLRHRFVRHLTPAQQAELWGVRRQIEQGLDDVLTAQRQASRVIAAQVRHHDPLRDRQVDDLLRDVVVGLSAWIPTTRRAQPVTPLRRLPLPELGRLRESLDELYPPQPPEPLTSWGTDGDDTLPDTSAWGGPRLDDLAAHLAQAGESTVAEVFAQAPSQLRRPVDLLGLLEVAYHQGADELDEVAVVEAQRPDGTNQPFAFAAVRLRTEDQ